MNKSKSKKEDLGIAQVEEATRLFERAWSTIGLVPKLTPQERRRSKKTPMTTKYGLVTSQMNGDALLASLARLEPIVEWFANREAPEPSDPSTATSE